MALGRRGRGAAEDLHERDDERQGLAGAGGGVDGDVLEAAQQGDRGGLHRRAELEAGLAQGLEDRLGEGRLEVGEARGGQSSVAVAVAIAVAALVLHLGGLRWLRCGTAPFYFASGFLAATCDYSH